MEMAATGDRGYLGNPVRHFQHLASRVVGPRAEIRAWRAWVCFHMAEEILGRIAFPRDGIQLVREGLWIPQRSRAVAEVTARGWNAEPREMAIR